MGTAKTLDKTDVARETTEAARRLFDVVRIAELTLVDCRAYARSVASGALRLSIRREANGLRSPDRKQACARVRFTLEGRREQSTEKEPDLFIEATFHAVYSVPEDLDASDDALNLFAHTNGTFNLWPYWREFVQTTSARMGVPGLTVPTYRVEEAFTGPGSSHRVSSGLGQGDMQKKPSTRRRRST